VPHALCRALDRRIRMERAPPCAQHASPVNANFDDAAGKTVIGVGASGHDDAHVFDLFGVRRERGEDSILGVRARLLIQRQFVTGDGDLHPLQEIACTARGFRCRTRRPWSRVEAHRVTASAESRSVGVVTGESAAVRSTSINCRQVMTPMP
jgi:hypothetical protein